MNAKFKYHITKYSNCLFKLSCYEFKEYVELIKYELLFTNGTPYDGIFLANTLLEDMNGTKLLDVGCGTGIVSIHTCCLKQELQSFSLEINPFLFQLAEYNFSNNSMGNRNILFHQNIFNWRPGSEYFFDTIACNPPLLPGEEGFCFTNDNQSVHFIEALLYWISQAIYWKFDLYLHVFDFYGIFSSTGVWPSLEKIAQVYGFDISVIRRRNKILSNESRTRKVFSQLNSYFPEGEVYINNELITIQKAVILQAQHNDIPIMIPHSILKIHRRKESHK